MKTLSPKHEPPKLGQWLLQRIIHSEYKYSALGDFEEIYFDQVEDSGPVKAWFWYWAQVVKSIPSFIIDVFFWSVIMFKNYLTIAFRNLIKHKGYSFINISGLAIGLACCLLILAYIVDELSFDRFHENANEIYRVQLNAQFGSRTINIATAPGPAGPLMIQDYPEVLDMVRLFSMSKSMFSHDDKYYYESRVLYAGDSFFNVFSFRLLKGNPETALNAPNTVVITENMAKKYFGINDPLGKILRCGEAVDLRITGIIQESPRNSHFSYDMLVSMKTLEVNDPSQLEHWGNANFYTYLLLPKNFDFKTLEAKLPAFGEKYIAENLRAIGGEMQLLLQPLTDIHLYSNLDEELEGNSDIGYIYAFSAIALFVLLMACINFMNLSTSRYMNRAKEVGMRKVLGAFRKQLTLQFLGESLLVSLISLAIAFIIVVVVLPYFNSLTGKNINVTFLYQPWIVAGMFTTFLLTGIFAGSYPALFLSGFSPIQVFRSKLTMSGSNAWLRSTLILLQFTISITLIIGTSIVIKQLNFMKNKRLGFHKEQMLVLTFDDEIIRNRIEAVKDELTAINGVVNGTASEKVPGTDKNVTGYLPEGYPEGELFILSKFDIDADFLKTYEIDIVQGRDFSEAFATDQQAAIMVNETMVQKLAWESPIGKKIILDRTTGEYRTVIGVFKDFHYESLYKKIEPLCLLYNSSNFSFLSLRLKTENITHIMSLIEKKWQEIAPDRPFEYFFLDQSFDSQYRVEERLGAVVRAFTLLSILIGSLGLFGLISFAAEQRTKEIGIRKALGASVSRVVFLLSKQFVLLVVLANVIAWPVAFFAMNSWLQNFAYRTPIGIEVFILSGLLAIVIALLTVSYQAIKAARANPVDALKYE